MPQLNNLQHFLLKNWDDDNFLYPTDGKSHEDAKGEEGEREDDGDGQTDVVAAPSKAKATTAIKWDNVSERASALTMKAEKGLFQQPVNQNTGETLLMLAVFAVGPKEPIAPQGSTAEEGKEGAEDGRRGKRADNVRKVKEMLKYLVEEIPVGEVKGIKGGRRGQMLDAVTSDGHKTALSCVILAAVHYNKRHKDAILRGERPLATRGLRSDQSAALTSVPLHPPRTRRR